MLIDFYSIQTHKKPNYDMLNPIGELSIKAKGFILPTRLPDEFSVYTAGELRDLFDTQQKQAEDELQVLIRYGLITIQNADKTREQYELIYFDKGDCFLKKALLDQATYQSKEKKSPESIYQEQPQPTSQQPTSQQPTITTTSPLQNLNQQQPKERKFTLPPTDDLLSFVEDHRLQQSRELPIGAIGISKSKIRDITGYSYTVKMPWHQHPVIVQWQKELIEADENIIVVDGSRQGGKSLTIAEKVIEESFIPGKDMMICAFLQETTDSIGEYMIDFMENFEDGTFTIKERKRYIQNNESGVRIHFRTLKDGAKGIRGKTLRLIVVDEAMLVPTSVFKSVLLPTQTTIENPKLILLGTASENTSCFMYKTITNIKKGLAYNNPGQRTARHIRFSVLENPLVSPIMKREIVDDQYNPETQREYFNKWGKSDDSLFQPKRYSLAAISDQLTNQAHIILAIDPARKQDRSAYVLVHCINNKAIILDSGEVPPAFKSDWTLQGKYFLGLYKKYSKFKTQSGTIDVTGVGDGVVSIFRSVGLPIADTVRYTSGDTESTQSEGNFMVGKSLLINNTIDMMQEDSLIIPYETNSLLLEELEFIQMTQTRMGKISFVSEYFDDITNAMMIAMYVIKKRRFMNRALIDDSVPTSFKDEYEESYKPKSRKFLRRNAPTSW